jgi:AcrR family transcriptional regulator
MDPFTRPDSADVLDMLADGAVEIVAEHGLLGLSISALARWSGLTPPVLTQRFQGPHGARRRVLHLVTFTYGQRWLRWSTGALLLDEPSLALPETDAERRGTRVWSALDELARGERSEGYGDIAAVVDQVRSEEKAMVAARLGTAAHPMSPVAAGTFCAVVDGVRRALSFPVPTFSVADARDAIRGHEADLLTGR